MPLQLQHRSIPAWAGETTPPCARGRRTGVYPRVGGGNLRLRLHSVKLAGLSPRGRGKLKERNKSHHNLRSIPAWAGETRATSATCWLKQVYPRVGGGNLMTTPIVSGVGGLSPRGRGKLQRFKQSPLVSGSIPAWAGETNGSISLDIQPKVYPRVGGGNLVRYVSVNISIGLSPRGRGKLGGALTCPAKRGSIPAWAGETFSFRLTRLAGQVYPRVGGGNE